MDDLFRQLVTTLRGMWQQRWIGLGIAWLVGIVGAVVAWSVPNRFEASARVYVDTQSVLKPLMTGLTVQPNVDQQIAILSRTLISRPNVEKLIGMADLNIQIKSPEQKDKLVEDLMGRLEMRGAGRDNLYSITFRDTQPERAKRIVQSLVTIFVESSLGDKRKDTDTARRFVEDQIAAYETKLSEAESRLKEFKLKHLSFAGDDRSTSAKLAERETALRQARLELREAENGRDAIKRQLAGEDPILLDAPDQGGVAEIDGRLDTLRKNLDTQLQRFTEQHPDVLATRRLIAQLEQQRQTELEARRKAGISGSSAKSNPVLMQLRLSLAEAEASVASLQTRVGEYQARYEELRASMVKQPEIEAEYVQLNRDYEVHKKNYEALVAKRESVALSGQMAASTGVAEFRLIDPPAVSPKPVAPNRSALLAGALAAALLAGVGSTLLVSQARPTFLDEHTVRHVTRLPVLGTVSLLPSPARTAAARRKLAAFAAGLLALLGAYAAASAFVAANIRPV